MRKRSSSAGNVGIKAGQRSRKNTLTRSIAFPSTILGEDTLKALRRYMLCFALVNFDIDQGPDCDNVYPSTPFSASELSDIAFSSFPDSTLHAHGAATSFSTFSWRIPRDRSRKMSKTEPNCNFLYGHVSFLQQKNESVKRNYVQRSLVLITHRPDLLGLFSTVMNVLGPLHTKPEAQASAIIEVVRN